jgi:hypothetical protein
MIVYFVLVKLDVEIINYSYLSPARYALELENSRYVITCDTFSEATQPENAKKCIKKCDNQTRHHGRQLFTSIPYTPRLQLENLKYVFSSDTFSEPTKREDDLKKSDSETSINAFNHSHLFPTRYTLMLETSKGVVSSDTFIQPTPGKNAQTTIKKGDC